MIKVLEAINTKFKNSIQRNNRWRIKLDLLIKSFPNAFIDINKFDVLNKSFQLLSYRWVLNFLISTIRNSETCFDYDIITSSLRILTHKSVLPDMIWRTTFNSRSSEKKQFGRRKFCTSIWKKETVWCTTILEKKELSFLEIFLIFEELMERRR